MKPGTEIDVFTAAAVLAEHKCAKPRVNGERLRAFMLAYRDASAEIGLNVSEFLSRVMTVALNEFYIADPGIVDACEKLDIRHGRGPINSWLRVPVHQFVALVDPADLYIGVCTLQDFEGGKHSDIKSGVIFDWDHPYDPSIHEPWKALNIRAEEVTREYRESKSGRGSTSTTQEGSGAK